METQRYPILRRWMVSYLIILGLPLLLSMGIYVLSRRLILGGAEEIYAAVLEQARIEADNQMTVLYRMLDQIAANSHTRSLGFVRGELGPEEYFTIYKLVGELRNYQTVYPLLDDALVALNRSETAAGFNGHMSTELLYELFFENNTVDLKKFQEILKGGGKRTLYQVRNKLLFLQNAANNNPGENTVTSVLVVSRSKFEAQCLNNFASNGSILYVADDQGQIIGGTAGTEHIRPEIRGTGRLTINGLRYRELRIRSDITGWEFHYLIPETVPQGKARQIQFFTLGGFILCSLFGVLFSLRMTKRNYREYHHIETSLSDSMKSLKKYYLYTLLEKPFDPVRDEKDMSRYFLYFPGDFFLVILFAFPEEEEDKKTITPHQVLAETFQEAAGKLFTVEFTDAGQNTAALVNWSAGKDMNSPLEEVIETVQQKISTLFALPVSAALGDPHRGKEGIYYSNLEAREALQYLDIQNGPGLIHYRDIREAGDRYRYPLEIEQRLINFLRLGDAENAGVLLKKVFDENCAPTGLSGQVIRILAADLLGTFMKGKLAETEPPMNEGLLSLEQLPVKDIPGTLEKMLEAICRANQSILEQKNSRRLGEKIKAYINENFTNPDLNISITALHFDLSPAYLSGIFREEMGLNLLEYINTLRVQEGKRLLEQGQSITKTAELAGFRGSSTFIRIFRKIAGVTPGQYRAMA